MPSAGAQTYMETLSRVTLGMLASDQEHRPIGLDLGAEQAVLMLEAARRAKQKVLLVGNGGSASIVGHLQMDLCNAGFVRALTFHDAPLLTALANDLGYPAAYERCIRLWAEEGDLLIAISSSGRSENILRAVRVARSAGCPVITFSGFSSDNPLRALGHLNFYAPSESYGHVELAHSILAHFLTDQVMTR